MIHGSYDSFMNSPFSFAGGNTLADALFKNDVELASNLLESGFRFTWRELVASLSNPRMHQLFLEHADNLFESDLVDQIKLTPLTESTQELLISLFSQEKFAINLRDDEGTPLLHHLVRSKNLPLLQNSLDHPKLDKKATDALGITAMQLAAGQGERRVATLLLRAGFDVNEEVPLHLTPLHIAADRGDEKMVALLLKHQANPNSKTDGELLPIHHALMHSGYQTNLIAMLHANEEFTPLQIAIFYNEGRHIFARSLYKKLDDQYKWVAKEMTTINFCGNLFELKGFTEIGLKSDPQKIERVSLEGLRSDRMVHRHMIKQLERLKNDSTFPPSMRTMLLDLFQFSELSSYMSNTALLQRFHERKPLMVRTGFLRHAIQFVFLKIDDSRAIFGVCDGRYPLQLLWFKPGELSETMLDECRLTMRTPSSYKTLLLRLKERLGQTDSFTLNIEKHYPLPKQKSGNCIVASVNAALWTVLALSDPHLARATELFECLNLDLKLHIVTKYFDSHLKRENPYVPDLALCRTLFEKLDPFHFLVEGEYKQLVEKFSSVPLQKSKKMEPLSEKKGLTLQIFRAKYYP